MEIEEIIDGLQMESEVAEDYKFNDAAKLYRCSKQLIQSQKEEIERLNNQIETLSKPIQECFECNNKNCTCDLSKENQKLRERVKELEDMLVESAEYGYNYHKETSFKEMSFKDNCRNNFLQFLVGTKGFYIDYVKNNF